MAIRKGTGNLFNILTLSPNELRRASDSKPYLSHLSAKKDYASCFFMVGLSQHSQLITASPKKDGYQVTVTPFDFAWDRTAALIAHGAKLGTKIVAPTFQGGLSFSTIMSECLYLC
jgi:hypothetical protein